MQFLRPYILKSTATILFVSLLCIGMSVSTQQANAAPFADSAAGVSISKAKAGKIAKSKIGGKVLKVELKKGKTPYYKVRLYLDNGTVKQVRVNAQNGKIF